jgi:hypothetical protein
MQVKFSICYSRLLFSAFWIFSSGNLCSQVDIKWLKNDLEFLSSDTLNGRVTGLEGGTMAARFISEEFQKIGLSAPTNCPDFLHAFELILPRTVSSNLIMNETRFSTEDFFIVSQEENIHVQGLPDVDVFVISSEDDFMTRFSALSGLNSNYIVLVDRVHQSRFNRLRNYMTPKKHSLRTPFVGYSLWVLTHEKTLAEDFELHVQQEIDVLKGYNVVGVLSGTKTDSLAWVIGAHYDHVAPKNGEEGKDRIYNGANDNASGVSVMLSLARLFKKTQTNEKPIWFVAFAAEEMGLLGSAKFVSDFSNESIQSMINLEMVGKPNEDLGEQSAYITGYELSIWPKDLHRFSQDFSFDFYPDPYPELQLFNRSDNLPFAATGIPAHTISTYTKADTLYHHASDEFDSIDFTHLKSLTENLFLGIQPLLILDYNPGKIDFTQK